MYPRLLYLEDVLIILERNVLHSPFPRPEYQCVYEEGYRYP